MRCRMVTLLAAAFSLGVAQAASAADMPVKAPIVKAPVVVPFSWTGLYAGVDAGYAWSTIGIFVPGAAAAGTAEADPQGFTVGGHLSYLYQFDNRFVVGAEGDMSWLSGDATGGFPGAPTSGVSASLKWDGSVRGVVGVAFDRVLVYGTGGWSWLNAGGCGTTLGACAPGVDFSGTHGGWTVGGGVAYAITPNIVARAEYLHADYGTFDITSTTITGGVANISEKTDKVRAGLSVKLWGPGGLLGQ